MGAIEVQSLGTGNRYLTFLKRQSGEGITWPDHAIGPVEKVGDIYSISRFKQNDFDHDLLIEQSAFMRKSFGHNGEEVTTGRREPSIQQLKVLSRVHEVNVMMWPWWG